MLELSKRPALSLHVGTNTFTHNKPQDRADASPSLSHHRRRLTHLSHHHQPPSLGNYLYSIDLSLSLFLLILILMTLVLVKCKAEVRKH